MRDAAAIGAAVVAEARSWIGTPVVWQQSVKGVGCDCKGLVAGVARECGLAEAESVFGRASSYSARVPIALLRRGLATLFDRVLLLEAGPGPGDIILMHYAGKPQHLGICTGAGVIHAFGIGSRRMRVVTETPLAALEKTWPIDSVWRWRGEQG